MQNPDPLLDVEGAAEYLGCTVRLVRHLISTNRLEVVRITRRIQVRRSVLDALIDTHTKAAR